MLRFRPLSEGIKVIPGYRVRPLVGSSKIKSLALCDRAIHPVLHSSQRTAHSLLFRGKENSFIYFDTLRPIPGKAFHNVRDLERLCL